MSKEKEKIRKNKNKFDVYSSSFYDLVKKHWNVNQHEMRYKRTKYYHLNMIMIELSKDDHE